MQRYRKAFREKVIPWYYKGALHVALFSVIQIAAIFYVGSMISWDFLAVLIVIGALMYATTYTYFLHRYLLHKPVTGLKWAFKMHHWHHTFYQSRYMEYDSLDDVYMLLMPPWLQLFYFAVYLPFLAFIFTLVFSKELVLPFIFGMTLWYGIYELVHWIEHLPKNHITMKLPFMKWLREHHIVHHSKLKDEANFGIVEPSWDFFLRTKK